MSTTLVDKLKNIKDNFWNLEEFQELLNTQELNIKTPVDLVRFNRSIYNRAQYLGYLSKLNFSGERKILNQFSKFSLDDIQTYINENNIMSKTDLKTKKQSLYKRYRYLITEGGEEDTIIFKNIHLNSVDERRFLEKLFEYGIKEIVTQFELPTGELKLVRKFRYDFYLPEYNCIIELHGPQHFREVIYGPWKTNKPESLTDIQQNDRRKLSSAINNGYIVRYFTFYEKDYEKFGYFEKVYTSISELLQSIGIKEVKMLSKDELQSVRDKYFKELDKAETLILIGQDFVDTNKIGTKEELRKINSSLYDKLKKKHLLKNIVFCYFGKKDYDIRYVNTPEDASKILEQLGLDTLHEVRKQDYGLYQKIKKHNWSDKIRIKICEGNYKTIDKVTPQDVRIFMKSNNLINISELYSKCRELYNKVKFENWII